MKSRLPYRHLLGLFAALLILFISVIAVGQSSAFTYQGRLTDGGIAANGNYDLQFALWDSLSGGGQVGSTQTLNTVAVSNAVFTVSLDFGANAFNGANRFLEIRARAAGAASFTTLTPRQPITSTPYALRSLNAASADSVPASGVPAGSSNYIQNTTSPQVSTNFNISGNGTSGGTLSGNVVNATTQFNLNGSRIVSNAGTHNLFVGVEVGTANSTGFSNTFVGKRAGAANTAGSFNSVFGSFAGEANTEGGVNSFFGSNAGRNNTTGGSNSFFGARAGEANTTGFQNSFFGFGAGLSNTTGLGNSFYGTGTGGSNLSGNFNSFFGDGAGSNNSAGQNNSFFGASAGFKATGSSNTFVGMLADFASVADISPSGNRNTLLGASAALGSGGMFSPNNATAIGANARVDQSNSLVLGSINGINFATADTNVGIGTTTPQRLMHIRGTGSNGLGVGDLLVTGTGTVGSSITLEATTSSGRTYSWISTGTGADSGPGALAAFDSTGGAYRMVINSSGNVGIGTTSPTALLSVNGTANKPGGGSWGVFSDERLKNIKGRFTSGLKAVMRLQPLRYEYKRDNALNLKSEGEHVGFSAQAVQEIIPEAVTATPQGYLLVNNDPILWTMLNAIKEQQAQIATLRRLNSTLNARLHLVERRLRKKSSVARRR